MEVLHAIYCHIFVYGIIVWENKKVKCQRKNITFNCQVHNKYQLIRIQKKKIDLDGYEEEPSVLLLMMPIEGERCFKRCLDNRSTVLTFFEGSWS